MSHIAFRCAYNDNNKELPAAYGYTGACSKGVTIYNVKRGAPWCSLPECPCSGYALKGDARPDYPCYESRMLLDWKAYAGFDHNGPDSWTARRILSARPGDIAFLTTRFPGAGEADRFIFAAFRIGNVEPFDPDKSGWVEATAEDRIALSVEEQVLFWDHYSNRKRPGYIGWGSGRFRYLEGPQAMGIMDSIRKTLKDRARKAIAAKLLELIETGR